MPRADRSTGLTVAITGPTGDIGRSVVRALERAKEVGRIIGMARRPFDPAAHGWKRTEYRQGDVLDRGSVDELVAEADVVVHLAFLIFGSHDETREVNMRGSRNVFEATIAAGVKRLVYTSSVAAYGFHRDNPDVLTEDTPPLGTPDFYYSAQKAELERLLEEIAGGSPTDVYVFRPCIVAGSDAPTLIEGFTGQKVFGRTVRHVWRLLEALPIISPVLPDSGLPFQLVHHDDVASAVRAAVLGRGTPGTYNLAADDAIRVRDVARALGWQSVPVPGVAVDAVGEVVSRVPVAPAEAGWVDALRKPVLMDTAKARRELRWRARHDGHETLAETVTAAREAGIL
ncbi:MAG TPA: NAD-dependent epimerase/dehydratase family protein [Solirubrobacterales bacterium]|nr:NAD-dependent epimerase/dehydratase family protein [Solirubrobacterales bacterium]